MASLFSEVAVNMRGLAEKFDLEWLAPFAIRECKFGYAIAVPKEALFLNPNEFHLARP